MAKVREITDDIDARLASNWPAVTAAQAGYFAAHGKYWQGLKTHSTPPADGLERKPDRMDQRPPSVAASWADVGLGSLPAGVRAALTMDEYQSTDGGKGFILTAEVVIDGKTWRRVMQNGPRIDFAQPWTEQP